MGGADGQYGERVRKRESERSVRGEKSVMEDSCLLKMFAEELSPSSATTTRHAHTLKHTHMHTLLAAKETTKREQFVGYARMCVVLCVRASLCVSNRCCV